MNTGEIDREFLRCLFSRPTVFSRQHYKKAMREIFPQTDLFIDFLKSKNESRINCAKDLILALVLQYPAAPAAVYLYNLFDLENKAGAGSDSKGYVPRDHFVHLVYLYLTGIYLFAHHRGFHDDILTEINQTRNLQSGDSKSVYSGNVYENFARKWSYFVLYHDLGYPLEFVNLKQRFLKIRDFTKINTNLELFSQTSSVCADELAVKALCRYLVVAVFLSQPDAEMLSAVLKKIRVEISFPTSTNEPNETATKAAEVDWATSTLNAVHIRYLTDPRIFELMDLILTQDDSQIWALLENCSDGCALALVKRSARPFNIHRFVDNKRLKKEGFTTDDALYNSAFTAGHELKESQRWRYFMHSPNKTLELIESKLDPIKERQVELRKLATQFSGDRKYSSLCKEHASTSKDLEFYIFRKLHRALGYLFRTREGPSFRQRYIDSVNVINPTERQLFDIVRAALSESVWSQYADEWKSANGFLEEINHKIITGELNGEFSHIAAEHLAKTLLDDDFRERFEGKLSDTLKGRIEKNIVMSETLGAILESKSTLIQGSVQVEALNIAKLHKGSFELKGILGKDTIGELSRRLNDIYFLEAAGYAGLLDKTFAAYKPTWLHEMSEIDKKEYGYDKGRHFDHGLFAGIITCQNLQTLRGFKAESPVDAKDAGKTKSQSAWRSLAGCKKDIMSHDCNLVQRLVVPAIILHNLYPRAMELSGLRKNKIIREKSAFTYLAIFADSIQSWGRPYLYNAALIDRDDRLDYEVSGIKVAGEKIFLNFERKGSSSMRKDIDFVDMLSEYLDGVDGFVIGRIT